MYYVIGANGSQYGPVDEATIRAWIAEGRVAAPSLSFKTGEAGWVPLQTREEFKELFAAAAMPAPGAAPPPPYAGQTIAVGPDTPKDWQTALLLSVLVGWIGVDRFYLGHVGLGILKIFLTCMCGVGLVWWIIDIVLIANGSVTDSRGRALVKRT